MLNGPCNMERYMRTALFAAAALLSATPAMAQQAIQQDPQTEFVGTLAKLYYKAIGDNAQLNAMVTSLRAENEKLKAPATPAPATPKAPK